jgi:hypothetical protein
MQQDDLRCWIIVKIGGQHAKQVLSHSTGHSIYRQSLGSRLGSATKLVDADLPALAQEEGKKGTLWVKNHSTTHLLL